MKILISASCVIVVMLILLTPSWFHSDYVRLFDKIILVTCTLNLFLIWFKYYKKYNYRVFLLISLLALVYCVTTIEYNEHTDTISSRIGFNLLLSENRESIGIINLLAAILTPLLEVGVILLAFIKRKVIKNA